MIMQSLFKNRPIPNVPPAMSFESSLCLMNSSALSSPKEPETSFLMVVVCGSGKSPISMSDSILGINLQALFIEDVVVTQSWRIPLSSRGSKKTLLIKAPIINSLSYQKRHPNGWRCLFLSINWEESITAFKVVMEDGSYDSEMSIG